MHPLVLLAKSAVENYIQNGKIISPTEDLMKKFSQKKAGVFVTIEKKGELRGCIGTYLPTRKNILEEIIYNAIAAATKDWRFGPVTKEELSELSYIVYILNKPELVKDVRELDPRKFGIIVKTEPLEGFFYPKTGLLLPDLEGVETVDQQIMIACQKAGIDLHKEKILIYKFTAEKYK